MALELKVSEKPLDLKNSKLIVKEKNNKKINLAVRRTLDGNLIIQDHHSIHIVVMPDKGKIITFPKDEYNQDCYEYQDNMFKHLTLAGVVKPDSVNGSNIYGSLEGMYDIDKKGDEEPIEVVLLNIYNFLTKQKEDHKIHKKYVDDLEKDLLDPEEDKHTEMGEIPHDKFKGSIPIYGFPTRGVYRYNY